MVSHAPPRASIEGARAAALSAIEADDRVYIGYSTLGWVRLWTGDLVGGRESFGEALRLNPLVPYALHGEADCLMLDGRMEESIARTRELLMVGPFSAMHNRPLPYPLFLARRYEEAIVATEAMRFCSRHWKEVAPTPVRPSLPQGVRHIKRCCCCSTLRGAAQWQRGYSPCRRRTSHVPRRHYRRGTPCPDGRTE